MSVTLDNQPITKVVEDSLDIILHKELGSIQHQFEEILKLDSLSTQAVDDLRDIECIIDEARNLEKKNQLTLLKKIESVNEKIGAIISKIKNFLNTYEKEETLPKGIFSEIREIHKSCRVNLDLFEQKVEFFKTAISTVNSVKTALEKDSDENTYRIWVEAVELLAEALEEGLSLFPKTPLGVLEDFALQLLSITVKENDNVNQKEGYRRRLRYAAIFILNLVKKTRLNSLKQESAEEKAINRIQSPEITEWIIDVEPEKSINLDEINSFF